MSFYFYFLAFAHVDKDYHLTGVPQENGNKSIRQTNESDVYSTVSHFSVFVVTCTPIT